MKTIGKIFKYIINICLFGLIAIGILVVFSFVPFPGNYKIFTVQSGSMEPAIHTGSLIFSKPMADYAVGDIVTKKTTDPKITITHRIISKGEIDGKIAFESQGDANKAPDGEKFAKEGIIGKEIINIPYIGFPVGYAKTTPGLILLIIIPAVIIVYDELNKIKKEVGKMWAKKKEGPERQEDKIGENDATYPEPQFVRRMDAEEDKKRKIV